MKSLIMIIVLAIGWVAGKTNTNDVCDSIESAYDDFKNKAEFDVSRCVDVVMPYVNNDNEAVRYGVSAQCNEYRIRLAELAAHNLHVDMVFDYAELEADHGHVGYSKLRKNELVSLLSNDTKITNKTIVKKSVTKLPKINLLDEYNMIEEVGSGSFGTVWRTKSKIDGETYALKLLYKFDEESNREIEILTQFQKDRCHPNIVCYYDQFMAIFNDKEYYVIKMEFIEGEPLNEWSESYLTDTEQPPPNVINKLLIGGISALIELHKVNIIHNDIKIENLMVRNDTNELVLVDFGLSCVQNNPSNVTDCHYTAGSYVYFSAIRIRECILSNPPNTMCYNEIMRDNDYYSLALSFYFILDSTWYTRFSKFNSDGYEYNEYFELLLKEIDRGWNPNEVYYDDRKIDAVLRVMLEDSISENKATNILKNLRNIYKSNNLLNTTYN